MAYTHVDTVVFGPAIASKTFVDLDLSSHIGEAKKVLAFFSLVMDANDGLHWSFAFKPKNAAGTWGSFIGTTNGHGTSLARVATQDIVQEVACLTDDNGVVEWLENRASGGKNVTVTFLGYEDGFIESNTEIHNGTIASDFETKDISSVVGAQSVLALIQVNGSTGSQREISFAPTDAPNPATAGAGGHKVRVDSSLNNLALVTTDSSGRFQWETPSPTANTVATLLVYWESGKWDGGRNIVFDDGAGGYETPPTVDTVLDLSSYVGTVRTTVLLEIDTESSSGLRYAVKPNDEAGEWLLPNNSIPGIATVSMVGNQQGYLYTQTDDLGRVNWKALNASSDIRISLLGNTVGNLVPSFSNKLPTGSTEKPLVPVSFTVDDDKAVDQDTINLTLTGPGPVTYNAIVNGIFQGGFSGTITVNGNGFDVELTDHPLLDEGLWTVDVDADDDEGENGTDQWTFTTLWKPDLVAVRAVGRRLIEIETDVPLVVRDIATLPLEPSDRYTAVDWIAHGGNTLDAANPANYVLERPAGAELDGDGEAIDILATYADEVEAVGEDSGTIRRSSLVRVRTDYQMTARAGYRITISNLESETGQTLDTQVVDFDGYIVSHVERNSLHLWDLVSGLHRRDDTDGTGDLLRLFTALQEVLDRLLEDIDAFFLELCDIDKLREDFLDTLLHDLGNPFEGKFTLTSIKKRRLASILVQIYREKGTCEGIINAVLFFVEVTLSGCLEPWDGAWQLAGGSYPSPTGPDQDELGIDTLLGAGTDELYTFRLMSPIALTAEQREQINEIADYMKPANTVYKGIIEP